MHNARIGEDLDTHDLLVFGVGPEADAFSHPPCPALSLFGAGLTHIHLLKTAHLTGLHIPTTHNSQERYTDFKISASQREIGSYLCYVAA